VLLQQHFQLVMITPTLAYPVVFTLENVLIVMGTAHEKRTKTPTACHGMAKLKHPNLN
jgi:hypothetical protein